MQKIDNQTDKKLNDMIDNTYLYMGRTVLISGWDYFEGNVVIFNEGNNIRLSVGKLPEALDDFLPANNSVVPAQKLFPVKEENIERLQNIEKVLLDNIKEVNEDPEKIGKVKAVHQQAKTLLDIEKFKLEIIKEARKGDSDENNTRK